MTTPAIVACLGDSLTLSGTGIELHSWPARLDVNSTLFPQCGVANFGKSGDQSSGFLTRYTSGIKGKGFAALVILGCINDVTNDVLATTSWANIEAIVDDAIADDLPVILISTTPFGNSSDWSAPRQTQLLALRALFAAKAGVTYLDLYTLGADPDDATALNPEWDYGDGKHYSADGGIAIEGILAPVLAQLFPAEPEPEAAAVATFGVTNAIIQTDYFSQKGSFTTETNPSSAAVDRFIQQKGAELGGKLRAEEQSPSAIDGDTGSEAYLWCQETLCLMVACRVAEDMMQDRPPLADTWEKRLLERLEALADDAEGTLGDGASSPTEQPDGPTHFIDELDLDTSENERCASSVTAPLRKDDRL